MIKKILIIIGFISIYITHNSNASGWSSNIVAGYRFEDNASSGNVYDYSGNGHTGTVTGCISTIGKAGVGKQFDGIDDYTNLGRFTVLEGASAQYSIALWCKLSDISAHRVLFNYYFGVTATIYCYYSFDTNQLRFSPGVSEMNTGINDLNDGNPHRLVFTKTATQISAYEDGHLRATQAGTGTAGGVGYELLLGYPADLNAWKGMQDEVIIYNKALTLQEVQQDLLNFSPGQ